MSMHVFVFDRKELSLQPCDSIFIRFKSISIIPHRPDRQKSERLYKGRWQNQI